jgi:lipopolysaccharide export LptBFGC system permease protein LptF
MIFAELSNYGANSEIVWIFAAGVLTVMFTVALVIMGITLIKNLIEK